MTGSLRLFLVQVAPFLLASLRQQQHLDSSLMSKNVAKRLQGWCYVYNGFFCSSFTIFLQFFYSSLAVLLQYFYSTYAVLLQFFYSSFAVLLQYFYSPCAVLLQFFSNSFTVLLQVYDFAAAVFVRNSAMTSKPASLAISAAVTLSWKQGWWRKEERKTKKEKICNLNFSWLPFMNSL